MHIFASINSPRCSNSAVDLSAHSGDLSRVQDIESLVVGGDLPGCVVLEIGGEIVDFDG